MHLNIKKQEQNVYLVKLIYNSRPIGNISYEIDRTLKILYLYTININEKYRRNGYGTILLDNIIRLYKEYNVICKILGGEENIQCMKLLKKFGFKYFDKNNEMMMRTCNH
jgi:ribosomal protein S18 acetylase RimI-like enzyme